MMEKDSRLAPIENYLNSDFLTSSSINTNIIDSLARDLKIKKEFIMHPNPIHYNRYINFICSRKFREISEGTYTERHHIIPRSLGGLDNESNLIILTGREHFIVHLILWKCFKGRMSMALHMMVTMKKSNKLTSRQYQSLRKTRKHSQESKKKISDSKKGVSIDGTLSALHRVGRNTTLKTKKKISEKLKGNKNAHNIPCSEEKKKKISLANVGKKRSKESKQKMSEAKKGKTNWSKDTIWMHNVKGKRKRISKDKIYIMELQGFIIGYK